MIIATFDTEKLNLPSDVERPEQLFIQGEITGLKNEIVVIMQFRRAIFKDAYLCHTSWGNCGWGIYDLPGFKFLAMTPLTEKEFDGIKFTMACTEEYKDWRPRANWIW